MSETIEIKDLQKLDLRVATVLSADKVDGADKLLLLRVDLGGEERQVVAGVAEHYAPGDLAGTQVVLVANLAPAKIRGIKSNGMILAASGGGALAVITPGRPVPPGAGVR